MPAPHGAVQIDHVFTSLSHPDKIVAGEDVTVVLNVRNAHSSPINLTYVTGMLASSQSFAVNIANFSVGTFSGPVQAGTDRGFEYKFATPERMPSRPFQVALTAFYDVDDGVPAKFATTFFNQTVQLMEPDKAVDTEALGLLLTFGAMLVAAGAHTCLQSHGVRFLSLFPERRHHALPRRLEFLCRACVCGARGPCSMYMMLW